MQIFDLAFARRYFAARYIFPDSACGQIREDQRANEIRGREGGKRGEYAAEGGAGE